MGKMNNKTAQKLKNAFWDIFENKDISDIRIEEIVTAAGYSRSLFYTYYKDIYDLYENIEGDALEKLKEIIDHIKVFFKSERLTNDGEKKLLEVIEPIYLNIERILRTLFLQPYNERFRFRIMKMLKQYFLEDFELDKSNKPELLDLYIEGLVGSHVATVSHSFATQGYLDLKQCINLARMVYFQNPHNILRQYRRA